MLCSVWQCNVENCCKADIYFRRPTPKMVYALLLLEMGAAGRKRGLAPVSGSCGGGEEWSGGDESR